MCTLDMALTMPVSSKSIARPQSLINRHRWGESTNAPSGNLTYIMGETRGGE